MIALTLEQGKMYDRQHDQIMTEIREQRAEIQGLIVLQKEHRIDIIALFQSQRNLGLRSQPNRLFTQAPAFLLLQDIARLMR